MKKRTIFVLMAVVFAFAAHAQYQLPVLAYDYADLEPYIDKTTMYVHYNNHHAAYTRNLNAALENYPELQNKNLEEIFRNLNDLPKEIRTSVRNNGGGYYNHVLFWSMLTPPDQSKMTRRIEKALSKNFGSVARFKESFEKAAAGRFGSGWVWLLQDDAGRLKITSTPNQDNPYMSFSKEKGKILLALDVWEHAYYLKYQSKRGDYSKAFWHVVNWQKVDDLMR